MYPHERSLVKRLQGRPFALIGVNSDRDRQTVKKAMQEENITWRSFWDGGSTAGPIATEWNVHMWPTIYVIDHQGVIRGKQVNGTALDQLIDDLVTQAEAG